MVAVTTLITGASGFLGARIAARLAETGHSLRLLVRRPQATPAPAGGVAVLGDVASEASLRRAMDGCSWVVHAAGLVRMWSRERADFDRINVGGLLNVAAAARATGASLLYVSSFLALGPSHGRPVDESSPLPSGRPRNDYERTKRIADRKARELGAAGQTVVRVYPGVVFGPGPLTAGNHVVGLLLQHARGQLPGLLGRGDRQQCFAWVDDVAEGVRLALERAAPGSGYVLGGENRTVRELFAEFARASGVPAPTRQIPFFVAALVGRAQRWRAQLWGAEPTLTDEVVRIYRDEWACSSAAAERDLGYRITPFGEGIARTVAWLRSSGRL